MFVSSVPSVVLQSHNREHEAKNPFNPSNPMFYDKSCFRVFRAIRSFTGGKTSLRGKIFAATTKFSYLCKRNMVNHDHNPK